MRIGEIIVMFPDTGPLYAAVDSSDQYHGRAQEEIQKLSAADLATLVAWPTIFEAYSLVVRDLGTGTAHTWLSEILHGTDQIVPTREDYAAAATRVRSYSDHAITLFDALLAVLSIRLRLPVWTYDHHFDVMRITIWR